MITSDYYSFNKSWMEQLKGKYPNFVVKGWRLRVSDHNFKHRAYGDITLKSGTKITYK